MSDVDATLAERGARYGDFTDHSAAAQRLQDVMRDTEGWGRLTSDKRQALTVIADKIARILTGDPEYGDNWHDIQGYAKLAEDRCAQLAVDDGWIKYNPDYAHPRTDECAFLRLRGGQEYPRNAQNEWDWSIGNHGGDITHYKLSNPS